VLKSAVPWVWACISAAAPALGASAAGAAPEDTAVAREAVPAKAAVAEEIELPPGFKPKKRGKYVVYCRSDAPLGSRIKQETCLDEQQVRDYLIALQETKGNVDRIRSTCSNVCTCGGDC